MSHFSTIKTKLKDRDQLLEALVDLGHNPVEGLQELSVYGTHAKDHPTVEVEVTVGTEIGFRWNEDSKSYELVTDLQTWDNPVPVERFLAKLSQQYALRSIIASTEEEGFSILEQSNTDDGSVELVVTRWI